MTNTIINNINADIISKANEANKAETERIVNTYQQMWGNGDSFIANDMAFLFGGAQRSGLMMTKRWQQLSRPQKPTWFIKLSSRLGSRI